MPTSSPRDTSDTGPGGGPPGGCDFCFGAPRVDLGWDRCNCCGRRGDKLELEELDLEGLSAARAESMLDRAGRTARALERQTPAGRVQVVQELLMPPVFDVDGNLVGHGKPIISAEQARELLTLPSAPDQRLLAARDVCHLDPRPSLLARLWSRLRQAGCGHAAATAHRVPGFGPGPVFERRCGRCGATWSEYG